MSAVGVILVVSLSAVTLFRLVGRRHQCAANVSNASLIGNEKKQ